MRKNLNINNQAIEEFITILDNDILNIELSLLRLDELRSSLVRRKDDELQTLIETVRVQSSDYVGIKQRRKQACQKLANLCGCTIDQFNLTIFRECVSQEYCDMITHRQETLRELTQKLSNEYAQTAFLLQEFTRINSMLMKSIFKPSGQGVIYNSKGKSNNNIRNSLLSCKF